MNPQRCTSTQESSEIDRSQTENGQTKKHPFFRKGGGIYSQEFILKVQLKKKNPEPVTL